jgi:hypothetical protein
MRLSTFGSCDPMSDGPRRIVPDVLPMPALKLGDPVQVLVSVESDNLSRLTWQLVLRFHPILSGRGAIIRSSSAEPHEGQHKASEVTASERIVQLRVVLNWPVSNEKIELA